MPINFRRDIGRAVLSDQRVWEHDRSQTVGASEVFLCLRRAFFKKRHPEMAEVVEEDNVEWGNMERGNVIEAAFAVPTLRKVFGAEKCHFMGEDQKTLVSGRLSATSDGIVVDQPRDALVEYGVPDLGKDNNEIAIEVKSFDPRTDLSDGVHRHHRGQNNVQMGLYREKTNYQPDYGVVIYFNPVDLKDIRPYVVKYDPNDLAVAKERADKVFAPGAVVQDFRPEGKATEECNYCEFARHCRHEELKFFPKTVRKDIPPEQLAAIRTMAVNLNAMRRDIKGLEKTKKLLTEDIKLALTKVGSKRAEEPDAWSAAIAEVRGRRSLDIRSLDGSIVKLNGHLEFLAAQLDEMVSKLAIPNDIYINFQSTIQALRHAAINCEVDVEKHNKQGEPHARLDVRIKG